LVSGVRSNAGNLCIINVRSAPAGGPRLPAS